MYQLWDWGINKWQERSPVGQLPCPLGTSLENIADENTRPDRERHANIDIRTAQQACVSLQLSGILSPSPIKSTLEGLGI